VIKSESSLIASARKPEKKGKKKNPKPKQKLLQSVSCDVIEKKSLVFSIVVTKEFL